MIWVEKSGMGVVLVGENPKYWRSRFQSQSFKKSDGRTLESTQKVTLLELGKTAAQLTLP